MDSTGKITGYKTNVGADTVFPFSTIVYLGSGSTFDVSSYDGYQNFTINNFIVEPLNNINKTVSGTSAAGTSKLSLTVTKTKSYNKSTGILSANVKCYTSAENINHIDTNTSVKAYLCIW